MTTEERLEVAIAALKLGQEMRQHQQGYFRSKKGLHQCREIEQRFDKAVAEVLNPQPTLFDPPEKVAGKFTGGSGV